MVKWCNLIVNILFLSQTFLPDNDGKWYEKGDHVLSWKSISIKLVATKKP